MLIVDNGEHTPISEVMTRLPVTIDGRDTVENAKQLLYEHDFCHLPVVRGSVLKGILTDRDLKLAYAAADDRDKLSLLPVEKICITEPCTADKTTPLSEVIKILVERNIGSVVITELDVPIGIFTLTDVARVLVEHFAKTEKQE